MILAYFLLAFLNPVVDSTDFCSCMNPGEITQAQVDGYDFIAFGTVQSVEEVDYQKKFSLQIEKTFKGGQSTESTVIITTAMNSAACGINPTVGDNWLIYAYERNSSLSTDLCTRSTIIHKQPENKRLQADLKFLNRLQNNSSQCHK